MLCGLPAVAAAVHVLLPGIPGSVEFVEGNGGLPTVMLKHACGASAQVRSSSSSSNSSKQAINCYDDDDAAAPHHLWRPQWRKSCATSMAGGLTMYRVLGASCGSSTDFVTQRCQ
jgi:hypothetical protein